MLDAPKGVFFVTLELFMRDNQSTFFFYDLETSGVNPRSARIMQFAGQRTTLDLKPIGEPVNVLIKLTPDVVPEPDAIMITSITPQQTLTEGITEAAFLRLFTEEVATPGTIFTGFNTVRFDDEFMRFLHYRNFYDPYEWQWQDGRSRWDLLDMVRMTRALRPEGITWPFAPDGKPTNRLELLTDVNGLDHQNAHDALSDVHASIALANLLRAKQQKLFEYLLSMRDKKKVAALAGSGEPFVYTSGQYASEYEKTTIAVMLAPHPKKQGALVYDLRHDPGVYKGYTPAQLAEAWRWKKDSSEPRLPIKTLQYNKCPAVAPLGVLTAENRERLALDEATIKKHLQILREMPDFATRVLEAQVILEKQTQTSFMAAPQDVDGQLYDGFFGDEDRILERALRVAAPEEVQDFAGQFHDTRLQTLVPLYKARNFASALDDAERTAWEAHYKQVLLDGGEHSRLAKYFKRLGELAAAPGITSQQQYLLEELQLYGQSIMPASDEY